MKTGIFFVSYGICAMAADVYLILAIIGLFHESGRFFAMMAHFAVCVAAALLSLRTYLKGVVRESEEGIC